MKTREEMLDAELKYRFASFTEDLNRYNDNLKKSIEIRKKLLINVPATVKNEENYKIYVNASLDTLIFEQKHLQKLIDRHLTTCIESKMKILDLEIEEQFKENINKLKNIAKDICNIKYDIDAIVANIESMSIDYSNSTILEGVSIFNKNMINSIKNRNEQLNTIPSAIADATQYKREINTSLCFVCELEYFKLQKIINSNTIIVKI
jgi:hypothetical protein